MQVRDFVTLDHIMIRILFGSLNYFSERFHHALYH